MSIGGKLFLRIGLLQLFAVVVFCCNCEVKHPQQIYCENEFAMKVLLQDFSYDDYGFTAKVAKVFKGDIKKLNVVNDSIVVAMDYVCGIEMIGIGKLYIFYGKNRNGSLYTNVCPSIRGIQPWVETSNVYKYGLDGAYGPGCTCSKERFKEIIQGGCIPRFTYLDKKCKLVKTSEFWGCIKYKYPYYSIINTFKLI